MRRKEFSGTRLNMLAGIDRCHSCLKSYHEIFDSPGRDCLDVLLHVSQQERPATEEALHVQSTFLAMLRSAIARHVAQCAGATSC